MKRLFSFPPSLKPLSLLLRSVLFLLIGLPACSSLPQTSRHSTSSQQSAFLHLELLNLSSSDHNKVTLFVDEEYFGMLHQWVQQTVRLEPGTRRLEIQVPGYLPQRFDLNMAPKQIVTLRLSVEPLLDEDIPSEKDRVTLHQRSFSSF